jgi:ABC-type lipoprotein export system ATPase subunit
MFQSLRFIGLLPDTLPESSAMHSEVWNSDAEVKKGEHVLVSATSGRGKSTFISLLYGLRSAFKGKYFYNGIDSSLISPARWSQIRSEEMAIVFQDLRLFPDYTVEENLKVKGKLREENFNYEECVEMCSRLGVEKYLDRKCNSLSYGERQRVSIVRALSQKAGLVLMDEPFSHLDRENAEIALQLILEKTSETGAALVITSLGQDYSWKYDRILSL